MLGKPAFAGIAAALVVCAAPFGQARAETLVDQNAEFRMQLDFVVPDAALRKFLPAGWEPNIATQGPAKDCNLRLIFLDRIDITGADGAATGAGPLARRPSRAGWSISPSPGSRAAAAMPGR